MRTMSVREGVRGGHAVIFSMSQGVDTGADRFQNALEPAP
jgi:hypothetical protein